MSLLEAKDLVLNIFKLIIFRVENGFLWLII